MTSEYKQYIIDIVNKPINTSDNPFYSNNS